MKNIEIIIKLNVKIHVSTLKVNICPFSDPMVAELVCYI